MFRRGLFERPVAVTPLPEQEHGARSREIGELRERERTLADA
jgi:hypothetical protein